MIDAPLRSFASSQLHLGDELGSGVFGIVAKGDLLMDNEPHVVAVKQLTATDNKKKLQAAVESLEREIQALAALKHKSIVQAIGIINEPKSLILEFVDGGDLHQLFEAKEQFSHEIKFSWARQLASAVAYIHNQGWIHRDIACRNLLLDRASGAVKLADFGLAMSLNGHDAVQEVTNFNVRWANPKLLPDKVQDKTSDIFAVGVVLA
eukprot:TRINITY_DN12581_c1_g1_i6.p3 TRINITY_DN12581_c1_g1~~TRINITY_DN12581_c1_g1_i6.p3  ORF type:complete len:207 (+),score=50.95 TRINITY_DN12581_c1_g1_i6:139-759(+)